MAVLILEDDEQVRVLAESCLQGEGFTTLSAATVEQAKALLEGSEPIELLFTDLGLQGDVWIYDAGVNAAQQVPANEPWTSKLQKDGAEFLEIAPAGQSGIGFLGDAGKFVGTGRKRIPDLAERTHQLTATVSFGAGEDSVRLFGFAKRAPRATAVDGEVKDLSYEKASGRFEVTVMPGATSKAELPGGDVIRQARVRLTGTRE